MNERIKDKMTFVKHVIVVAGFVVLAPFVVNAVPYVTNVVARQRQPWNGLVDITVTLVGTKEECSDATFVFKAVVKSTKAELSVWNVSPIGTVVGEGDTWSRKFVWNATDDVGRAKFGDVVLTVGKPSIGVQLWEGGPYWAECNLGASQPEEFGYYFWWGDTVGCKRNVGNDGWISAKDGTEYVIGLSTPTSNSNYGGYIDASGNLAAAHDAATFYLGALWRMPTSADFGELLNNCTSTWITTNSVSGYLVTGKGNYASKSIFLPASGYGSLSSLADACTYGGYWSSTPTPGGDFSYCLSFYSTNRFELSCYGRRSIGFSIRPIRAFAK